MGKSLSADAEKCGHPLPLPLQDIFSLFHLDRPFKFVSKTSNFYIPIVGWSMFLTGAACMRQCLHASLDILHTRTSASAHLKAHANRLISLRIWCLVNAGHVMINRMDTRSMMQCLLHCGTLLKQVISSHAASLHGAVPVRTCASQVGMGQGPTAEGLQALLCSPRRCQYAGWR